MKFWVLNFICIAVFTIFLLRLWKQNRYLLKRITVLQDSFYKQQYDLNQQQVELAKFIRSEVRTFDRFKQTNPKNIEPFITFESQFGEDIIIFDFFYEQEYGYCLEVGAFDGKTLSNSYVFEKIGWDCILIEPHPTFFRKCKINRPNSSVIQAAIGSDSDCSLAELKDAGYFHTLKRLKSI